jgi:hypothetical protein
MSGRTVNTPAAPDQITLTWPDRIEHYRRVLKRDAFMGFESEWAFGVWFLGNSWHVASGYYGGYPAGYLKRIRALFPDKQRVLHLFSGKVDVEAFPGDTCDINGELHPTYVADAHTLIGVPVEEYDLILADPSYSAEDADHYGTPTVDRNKVVRVLAERMKPGAHLVWLDQAQPMYSKKLLKPECAIGIVRSTMHRYRCVLIWRKLAPEEAE